MLKVFREAEDNNSTLSKRLSVGFGVGFLDSRSSTSSNISDFLADVTPNIPLLIP